jgi:hypothetical protein
MMKSASFPGSKDPNRFLAEKKKGIIADAEPASLLMRECLLMMQSDFLVFGFHGDIDQPLKHNLPVWCSQ